MPLPAGLTPVDGGLPAGLSPVDDEQNGLPAGLAPVTDADFSDVKGGSSSTNDTYWQGVRSRFNTAIHNPMEAIGGALDPLLKPVRESLQQGGITGDLGPDIAKQAFGPKAGGFAAGVEREVAPGLASGENAAIMAAMAAAPETAPFLLAKFGKEGTQSAIAASQAPPNETPEEAGRRYAQMAGGAAMAVAPLVHAGAGPVREAVSRFKEPAARLDFDAVRPEDLAPPQNTVSRFNLAESDKAFRLARDKQAALDAMKKFEEELPEPPAPKVEEPPPVEPVGRPGFAEDQGFDPRVIKDFNDWADQNRPAHDDLPQQPPKPWAEGEKLEVPREIQDAAAEVPEATQLEIQQAAERLRALDESAGKSGAAGGTATGSLGESAGPQGERAADPAARSTEPLGDRATEAGESPIGAENVGAPAAGAEGVPVGGGIPDASTLPGAEFRHNQATVNELRRVGGLDSIEESRFKTTEAAIKAEAEKNIGPIIRDLMTRQPGEPITAVENAAVHAYIKHIVENPSPEGAAALDHLSKFSYEGRSAVGRALGFGGTAMDEFMTDPGKAVQEAMKATKGKMSQEAKMDIAALAQKAKVRKERIDAALADRTRAAIERLEAQAKASLESMKHDISRISVEDILKCR